MRHHLQAERLRLLLEFVREALAVGRRIVDDGHRLDALLLRVVGERRALLRVGRDDAVGRLEALLRVGRVRRRRRDLQDAGIAVDLRGRNRRSRIQVADHRDDLAVDELLRDLRRGARVGRVVLRVELERDLLAADREALRIDLLDRETRAVLVVLAEVGDAARQGLGAADLHDLIGERMRRGRGHHHRGRADRQQSVDFPFHCSLLVERA
ncbi:hypothetical protein X963_5535 [Burkholderia pseudomallei MSHR7498]|nr:hypothetical protein X963_5535 [Burkholderia pseudomallei MSHR7498]